MQKHNESFTLSRICRQKHGIGGTIYASTGREYIQTPGWTLGGALYCGKEAGWAGNLPLRVRRILPFRAAKAGALPGGKPKAVIGCIQSIRIFIAVLALCQTQGFQEVRTLGLVHGVQDFHMAIGGFGFAVLENISYLYIGKLDTLNGISVAGFAVSQSGGSAAAQDIVYPGFVINVFCPSK